MSPDATHAARNNAAWCDAVCAAHGQRGERVESHWRSGAPMPPRYPNLVTLSPAVAPVMAAVEELVRARPSASWGVKDSFAVLPLERAGFHVLFMAEWIVRAPGRTAPGVPCIRIHTDDGLAAWETAWGESAGEARVFLPPLLRRSEITFLARADGTGAISAGVVANRSDGVVGVSNVFGAPGARRECLDAVAALHPDLPLVGYETGTALAEARAHGFRSLGALTVWLRTP